MPLLPVTELTTMLHQQVKYCMYTCPSLKIRPSIVRIKPAKSRLISPFTHFHARRNSTSVRFFFWGRFDSIFRLGGCDIRKLLGRKSTQGRIDNERRGKSEPRIEEDETGQEEEDEEDEEDEENEQEEDEKKKKKGEEEGEEEEEEEKQLGENPDWARWFNLGRICKFTRSILTALKENIDSPTTPLATTTTGDLRGGNIPPHFVICFPRKNFRQITAE